MSAYYEVPEELSFAGVHAFNNVEHYVVVDSIRYEDGTGKYISVRSTCRTKGCDWWDQAFIPVANRKATNNRKDG